MEESAIKVPVDVQADLAVMTAHKTSMNAYVTGHVSMIVVTKPVVTLASVVVDMS